MKVREANSGALERELRQARERIAELERDERRNKRVNGVLTRLASLADHSPSAIVEFDGAVTYTNHAAREMFPDLISLGVDHPLLAGLEEVVYQMRRVGAASRTRHALVGGRTFSQKIVLERDAPQVSVYSDDVTEDRERNDALERASGENALLAAENALLAEIGMIISSSLEIDEVLRRLRPAGEEADSVRQDSRKPWWTWSRTPSRTSTYSAFRLRAGNRESSFPWTAR